MRRRALVTVVGFVAFVAVVHACTHLDDVDADPREGELGKVRFVSGGGCSSSVTLAVGSTAEMTLEPVEGEALPVDMLVTSSETDVIGVETGDAPDEIRLHAARSGESDIEILDAGMLWDWLRFRAEPAASVVWDAPGDVWAGDVLWLQIEEVHGACGEDCPLIGGEFVEWSSSPAGALVLGDERDRTSVFDASAAGEALLVGDEPSEGVNLVLHTVDVHDPAGAGDLDARIAVMFPDESIVEDEMPPLEVPLGSLVQVRFFSTSGVEEVPLSRWAVEWTTSGDPGVLEEYALEPLEAPEGPIFSTVGPGTVSLLVDCVLLDRTATVDVTVVE